MKKFIAFSLVLIFPFTIFSQVNVNAAEMKKKGIKELRHFPKYTDTRIISKTVPYNTIYFDREGRVTKLITLIPQCDSFSSCHTRMCCDLPVYWEVTIVGYDTFGRIASNKTKFSYQSDPYQMTFFKTGRSQTYFYSGDSLSTEIDSLQSDGKISAIRTTTQNWHWAKTTPPDPRPILWPDSICVRKTVTEKSVDYHYKTESDSLPEFIDSTFLIHTSSWSIENGKVVSNGIIDDYSDGVIRRYEISDAYTLNQQYDTTTRQVVEKYCRDGDTFSCDSPGNLSVSKRTYHTKRTDSFYEIIIDEGRVDKYNRTMAWHVKTKDPWSNDEVKPDYDDRPIFTDDWEISSVRNGLKYGKTKTIYW